MDEDAKVHWAETVEKPRYRQFTISGEPRARLATLDKLWLRRSNLVSSTGISMLPYKLALSIAAPMFLY
jgi:hypothetical protein